jgi:hypothetical protein
MVFANILSFVVFNNWKRFFSEILLSLFEFNKLW